MVDCSQRGNWQKAEIVVLVFVDCVFFRFRNNYFAARQDEKFDYDSLAAMGINKESFGFDAFSHLLVVWLEGFV